MLRDASDLATDRRLLVAFEATMGEQCRCWTAIVSETASGAAAAGACLCLFTVDPIDTTGVTTKTAARVLRRLWPGSLRFRVLFCGLPVPSGENHLRMRNDAADAT